MAFGKKYDPSFEAELYTWREQQGVFKPSGKKGAKPFVTMLPPPNVTGKLHLGHSVMAAIEDVMVRYHRMLGSDTLWVPGTDHASISTEVVVTNQLAEKGIDKKEIGREKFLGHVWDWVAESRGEISTQIKAMGASLDWEREQFTVSEKLSRSVRTAFKKLYDEGKIYKSTYMVNRSPGAQTVLSDIEVENKEVETKMYYIRYFVQGKGDSITVATIRPETIFADVAIAVHPKDRRYKKWIGRNVLVPIVNKPIPVIADESVQIDFGTGALKITPTHSEMDYEIAKNHDLPMDRFALDKNNIFTELAGEAFAGKDAYEFMDNLVHYLGEIGNLDKIEDYKTTVPTCERTGVLVQPLLSQQWFMGVKHPADRVLQSIEKDEVTVHPPRFKKIFANWLEDIRPRCISRQLRWGHRIPVWYNEAGEKFCFDDESALNPKSGDSTILSRIIFNLIADSRLSNPFTLESLIELLSSTCFTKNDGRVIDAYCGVYKEKFSGDKAMLKEIKHLETIFESLNADAKAIEKAGVNLLDLLESAANISGESDTYKFDYYDGTTKLELTQEEDVLDTWFSSALRPFTTLGWPENTKDLEKYYPNSVLETGYDIIFFWVIRMMLMGVELTDQLPFKEVYFHGLVRAKDGSKMSKSKGNGVDPMKVIEEYGADALRGSLLLGNTPGNDQKFSEQKVEYVARFINKLRNASRFVASRYHDSLDAITFESFDELEKKVLGSTDEMNDYDRWMLGKLAETINGVTRYQEKFMIGEALQDTITLVWHEFCDWFIEIAKIEASPHTQSVMMYVLGSCYKLLHPALPFVSEKLRGQIGFEGTLAVQTWPESRSVDEKNYRINLLMDMISQWRTLRTEVIEKPHEKVSIYVQGNKDIHQLVGDHQGLIMEIVKVENISFIDEHDESPDGFTVGMLMDIKLGVKGLKERNWKEVMAELETQVKEEEAFLQRLRITLTSPGFTDKAPPHVVEDKKNKMTEVKTKIAKLQFEINKIKMNH